MRGHRWGRLRVVVMARWLGWVSATSRVKSRLEGWWLVCWLEG